MEASAKSKAVTTTTPADQPDKLEMQLLEQARTPQERQMAFHLASQARQAKMVRDVAVACAETGWGKDVSPMARAAVVRYCMEIGADPVRHVNVLGGNPYLNASFWMDLVAANPAFRRADVEFIHEDKRASDEEREDRKAKRVTYGVPEDAPGAAIVTLHYEGRGPFIGVNWAGIRANDPVGKQEPTKTAETRAYRRAAIKAEPAWFKKHPRLEAAHELIVQGRDLDRSAGAMPSLPAAPEPAEEVQPPEPVAEQTERHNPSAQCLREGPHPRSECGYFGARKS